MCDDHKKYDWSRREFLEASGFGLFLAALAGCGRAPVQNAFGYIQQPEGAVPGGTDWIATVCGACPAGCGVLAKNRDGRPIKLEGNPQHPLSQGGLCAAGQAAVLGLYDSQRLQSPLIAGKPAAWDRVDNEIRARLKDIRARGGAVRFLGETVIGPTKRAMIRRFLEGETSRPGIEGQAADEGAHWKGFSDARHVIYDSLSASALLDAHRLTHGVRLLPQYRLGEADVIVGLDADFMGAWISPVAFTADYRRGREPEGQPPRMSYHVQFESRMSLTGACADRRLAIPPECLGTLLNHLAVRLAEKASVPLEKIDLGRPPVPAADLDRLADRLWQARGRSVVLCGSQDVKIQVSANFVNHLLDAYGATILLDRPSHVKQGDDRRLSALVREIREGKVAALFIAGANPVYELPEGGELKSLLRRIPLTVSFGSHLDETAAMARYVCPESHFLESWGDAEPAAGVASVAQPALRPLGDTRPLIESLAAWMDRPQSAYELVRRHWEESIFPRRAKGKDEKADTFEAFWEDAAARGCAEFEAEAPAVKEFAREAVQLGETAPEQPIDNLTLLLYPTVALQDGRHALNPWLQELPDPVSKVTWDNYASLSRATAAGLGVEDGDVIRIACGEGEEKNVVLELPALIQPGQHDRVVAVALGYGRRGTERFAKLAPDWIEARPLVGPNGLVGTNAAPCLAWEGETLRYRRNGVTLTKTGEKRPLACTQQHHEIAVPPRLATPGAGRRPMIEEVALSAYRAHPQPGGEPTGEHGAGLWPDDHPYAGKRWGMVIDLARCTGCSACVVACQAENNVPVVGRDEVRRSREMHWLRIDRYYSEAADGVDTAHQPMLCHHCENAPCENVCPVLATVHSEEGLNQQVYNRCVGTRYCANNCPYKVRRFNWFRYARDDRRENLALNPDVTVRSRGVMEKCSFCAQRIQEARLEAKRLDRELRDGEIQPACQQSCPAQAIAFGDLNDPKSRVARLAASSRYYQVLSELNIRPAVGYLRRVRNRDAGEGGMQHG
ncbi:MAG: 4Fe-4S dicluster domain-containing protein [Pirellulales bacterium]|nr:4Fe-4S dicluster domain-containing protein [Pirellulales bacterium]